MSGYPIGYAGEDIPAGHFVAVGDDGRLMRATAQPMDEVADPRCVCYDRLSLHDRTGCQVTVMTLNGNERPCGCREFRRPDPDGLPE